MSRSKTVVIGICVMLFFGLSSIQTIFAINTNTSGTQSGFNSFIIEKEENNQVLIQGAILSIIEVRSQLFFYIIAKIQNKLPDAFENINWSIVVDGGTIFCGRETYGTIPEIRPGQIINLFSNPIFGIGKIELTVRIYENGDLGENWEKCDGFVFGPLLIIENY